MGVLLIQFGQREGGRRAQREHTCAYRDGPAGNAARDDGGGGADYDAEDEMIHEGVGFAEQPREELGQQHDAHHHADDDGNEHAEIKRFDTGGHGLIEAQIDQEIGRAHAGYDQSQTHQ